MIPPQDVCGNTALGLGTLVSDKFRGKFNTVVGHYGLHSAEGKANSESNVVVQPKYCIRCFYVEQYY